MATISMDNKEELVMKLVHYFVTKCNYTPIVVNGVKNEVWLENLEGPYRIIRINSNYIHNKEQFNRDLFKIKNVVKQIKKKTLSFNINTLNIFLDLNKDVDLFETKNIDSIYINKINDLKRNKIIIESFPDISTNLNKNKGIDLIINVTNDINKKTAEENKKYEKTFGKKNILITPIIIAICTLMFLIVNLYPGLVYLLGSHKIAITHGEIWRLITPMFIHIDPFHLLCNMYSLYIIGKQVENFVGKAKFVFIYLISGILGSLLSITFSNSLSIGASGAIFGLLGSILYFGSHYRLYLSSVIKNQIIPIIVINLIISFSISGIDFWGHVGGLIGGYLASTAIGIDDKTDKKEMINGWIVLTIILLFLVYLNLFK